MCINSTVEETIIIIMVYIGQDYRYRPQHGNNTRDRSEHTGHEFMINTWRNNGRRRKCYFRNVREPRDKKAHGSYYKQYIDRYAQHMDFRN